MEDLDLMTLPQAALCCAESGFSVLRLRPRDTKPISKRGVHDASSDPEIVPAWWQRWPDANIGLACRGLPVIDIDPRNGGPADRGEFIERFVPIPGTAEALSRGRHQKMAASKS
jgi:hypothetical protein